MTTIFDAIAMQFPISFSHFGSKKCHLSLLHRKCQPVQTLDKDKVKRYAIPEFDRPYCKIVNFSHFDHFGKFRKVYKLTYLIDY